MCAYDVYSWWDDMDEERKIAKAHREWKSGVCSVLREFLRSKIKLCSLPEKFLKEVFHMNYLRFKIILSLTSYCCVEAVFFWCWNVLCFYTYTRGWICMAHSFISKKNFDHNKTAYGIKDTRTTIFKKLSSFRTAHISISRFVAMR